MSGAGQVTYVVVEFCYNNTLFISAAPEKWVKENACWWPSKKDKERKLIRDAIDPEKDWTLLKDVTILGHYGPSNDISKRTPPLDVKPQSSHVVTSHNITPDMIRPYPEVTEPRKTTGGRKQGSSKALFNPNISKHIKNDLNTGLFSPNLQAVDYTKCVQNALQKNIQPDVQEAQQVEQLSFADFQIGDIDWLLKELQVFEEKPLGVKPNLVKELSEKVAGDENTIHSEYKSIVMDSFHWKKKIRRGEESESRKTEKLSENMKNQKTKEQTEVTQDVEVVRKKQKCGVCDHELNSDTDEEGETHAQSGFS
ncbi:hypothetical protein JTB14_025969 [Gonioctena quinquepunctata]|nr:hypothetical protein JTB14_025969 [Gonioctena quinquepunctata]